MKILKKAKDGGPESTVTGYWLCEFKKMFSVVLLKFEDGSRDAYHNHAFNSLNWVLKGKVVEHLINYSVFKYLPSLKPIVTTRGRFHKVVSEGTTWVLSLRGPWHDTWMEFDEKTKAVSTLTHGRKVVTRKA